MSTEVLRGILRSSCLKGWVEELKEEWGTPVFGPDSGKHGIGEGFYYKTVERMVIDYVYQFFGQDWETMFEVNEFWDLLTKRVEEEIKDAQLEIRSWRAKEFEDRIDRSSYRLHFVPVRFDLSDFLGDVQREVVRLLERDFEEFKVEVDELVKPLKEKMEVAKSTETGGLLPPRGGEKE